MNDGLTMGQIEQILMALIEQVERLEKRVEELEGPQP